jgi:hypothetical protein
MVFYSHQTVKIFTVWWGLRRREEFDKIQVFLIGESLEGMIDFPRGVREGVLKKIGTEVLLRLGRVE